MPSIGFANPLAWWVVVPILVVLVWHAWHLYVRAGSGLPRTRRLVLVALRTAVLVTLVLLLMRPVRITPDPDRTHRVVPVLVDASRSMDLRDGGTRSRLDAALAIVGEQVLPALRDGFRTDVLTFGQRLGPADEPDGIRATAPRSDLGGALRELGQRYQGQRLAGVIVVSDGAETGSADPVAMARDLGAPVFTVGVGNRSPGNDREVLALSAGEANPANALVRIMATVVDHGSSGKAFDVRVLENGRLAQVESVAPEVAGAPVTVEFLVAPPKEGAAVYTVEVPGAAGEAIEANNRRSVLVRPAGRRRRVLLVQGTPGPDHSFLTRALLHDPALELDVVVRKGFNDRGDATYYIQGDRSRTASLSDGYPATREALFAYDALMIANLDLAALAPEHLEATAAFVGERGGGLLVMGRRALDGDGLAATPLAPVLPVEVNIAGRDVVPTRLAPEELNRLVVTAEGSRHPILQLGPSRDRSLEHWALMPALAATTSTGRPRPGATVLARTQVAGRGMSPLLVVQRFGTGRSLVLAGDGSWRWRMARPAADRTYETFWRQAVRWVADGASDPVTASAPPDLAAGDEAPVTVTVRDGEFRPVANADVEVEVVSPDGRRETLPAGVTQPSAGRYQARFASATDGIYRLRARATAGGRPLGTADVMVLVGGNDPEFTEPRLHDDLLRRVAEASGGRFLAAGDMGSVRDILTERASEGAPPIVRELWHGPWTFLALVTLLGTEWVLRRAWGLR